MTTGTIPTWTITDRLHKARKMAGLNFDELAARLDVSERTLRRMESGEVEPRRATVVAWAVVCGVDAEWVLFGDGPSADTWAVTSRYYGCTSTEWLGQIPGQMSLMVAA